MSAVTNPSAARYSSTSSVSASAVSVETFVGAGRD